VSAASGRIRTDLRTDARSMARGAGINLFGAFAASLLGFFVTYAITHLVTARAIGLVAIGTTLASFALIPSLLGLDTGIVRFVARGASADDEQATRASYQVGIGVVLVISVALTILIWWQAPFIGERFFHKSNATEIIRLMSLALPALALSRATMSAVQGFGVMIYSAWLGVLRRLFRFAAVVPLVALGLGARGLAIGTVIASWASCVVSFSFLLRVDPNAARPARRPWPLLSLLNFSIPQVLTGLLFFAILWTDTLLLGRFGTAAEVGVYSVLATLLGPPTLISTSVGQMFAPRIAAEDARGDKAALATMLKRVTHWNTAISIPLFALLAVVPAGLLSLFGPTYRSGAHALAILAVGQLLNTAAGPLGQLINMSGRQYLTMTNNGVVAALNVVGCLLLIPRYGMTGAACSTAASLTLVNLVKLLQVKVIYGIHPFQRQTWRVFLVGGGAAFSAAIIALLPRWPTSVLEAFAGAIALLIVYTGLAWMLALTEEDKELVALGRARIRRTLRPSTFVVGG
jgi:O-antigen/teichoic acid export membrane protein